MSFLPTRALCLYGGRGRISFPCSNNKNNLLDVLIGSRERTVFMQLEEYLDVAELQASIDAGWVRVNRHEDLDLRLYGYTEHAQFDGVWNDATRKSRGLIVNDSNEIVAFCMPKFFNYSEHVNGKPYAHPLPYDEDFEIFAKVDGSMGTCFFYAGEWHVATRGSFHSDQAKWATAYLRKQLALPRQEIFRPDELPGRLLEDYTYVCEIIYPGNRIVVDYGDREDLVLLTSFWNKTGEEVLNSLVKHDWSCVGYAAMQYAHLGESLDDLQAMADENVLLNEGHYYDKVANGTEAEGYVIRFSSGTRCKIKLGDYLRLHKVLTGCTERSIWELISEGGDLWELLVSVPDEFRDWAIDVNNRLMDDVYGYIEQVNKVFDSILKELDFDRDHLPVGKHRKEFALKVAERYNLMSSGLFFLLDQNDKKLEELAWKMFKPAATKAFASDS